MKVNINKTKVKKTAIKTSIGVLVGFILTIIANAFFNKFYLSFRTPIIIQSPVLVHERIEIRITEDDIKFQEETIIPEATDEAETSFLEGSASYYSFNGCLGCNSDRIMANGDILDDNAYTLALTPAMFKKYKNEMVMVTNVKTKDMVVAKVTDSGGFEKYDRVADLSVATKNALNCGDICQVRIDL